MRVITAKYNAYSDFRIPKNVPLLSVEDNESDKAWSWWIKWDKLNYVDDKGEHHEIKAFHSASEDEEFKRPDDVQEDEYTTGDTDDEDGWDDCEKCGQLFENEPDCPKICGECEKDEDDEKIEDVGECGRCGEDNNKGGTELWNDLCNKCDKIETPV
jgi:hypothetical protein